MSRREWAPPEQRAAVIGTRVGGEGPQPCRVMVVGEFPGVDEGLRGRPFVGRSGREFMRYLNGYELPQRHELYLTNLSKTVAKDAKGFSFTPEDEQALWAELAAVRPTTIVTLGHHSTRYWLGDVTLEAVHGIPHRPRVPPTISPVWAMTDLLRDVIVLPCYNPAAALYAPNLQAFFAQDMRHLSLWLKGRLPPVPRDLAPGVYRLVDEDPGEAFTADVVAVDTEGWPHRPWGASWSDTPYTGQVARAGTLGWDRFADAVRNRRPRLVIHNALHDIAVLAAMGLDLDADEIPFDDTMVMAYLLGLEPQGLKPLAYRHAGMVQDDYADLVADVAEEQAFRWLFDLAQRLPEKLRRVTTKRELKAAGLDPEAGPWWHDTNRGYVPDHRRDPGAERLAHARALIERMLGKADAAAGLGTRWAASTAREILVDEQGVLPVYAADPPEPTLDEIPIARATTYAGRDADATIRVYPHLQAQIAAYDLEDVYAVDMAILPMIARMQQVGLGVDVAHFEGLSQLFAVEAELNAAELARVAGRPINPNSGDQVAALIFDELQLHQRVPNLRLKKTDSGERFTTNDKVLDALKGTHPIVALIQDGREIRKLKGTYADPIPALLGRDGRLHPRYRITRTDTGRLSAGDPNVLAFPKHSTRGQLVRQGFVAGDGRELGEWDLAQIEMCVFAHDSGDAVMIAEIASGVDKHATTAGKIFGRDPQVILEEKAAHTGEGDHQRFAAKAVNFGILMGITAFGLLDQFHKNGMLSWTLDDCERLLQEWFKAYPGAKAYIERKHAEARRHGFVRDLWGRLRWLEGIHSDDDYIRAEAERMAQATPVQSGAQGIIKRIMRAVWPVLKSLRQSGLWVEPLLQVHDALVLEYAAAERALIDSIMMTAMTTTVTLRVPVKASHSFGTRLGDL